MFAGGLLKHAAGLVSDFLVGRAGLGWVDVVAGLLAKLLLGGVETWISMSAMCQVEQHQRMKGFGTLVEVVFLSSLVLIGHV